MGCEYGHVMQAKIVVDDSEAEEVVIIWRRVPSRGQNHMVGFELSMEPIKGEQRAGCDVVTLQLARIKAGLGFEGGPVASIVRSTTYYLPYFARLSSPPCSSFHRLI
jgi:hypothetical protein